MSKTVDEAEVGDIVLTKSRWQELGTQSTPDPRKSGAPCGCQTEDEDWVGGLTGTKSFT